MTTDHPKEKTKSQRPFLVPLGKTNLHVSRIGTGTWQWGGAFYWGYGRTYTDKDLAGAYNASIENGINWFDTAEIYGRGKSEKLISWLTKKYSSYDNSSIKKPLVATKFFPYPWRWKRGTMRQAVKASLIRLNSEKIDLYQIHFPFPPRSYAVWVEEIADIAKDGLIGSVGVSNFSSDQTKRAYDILEKRGIILASNQVGYSLLNRKVESDGLIQTCKEIGVSVISYGPLAEGLLTGKYRIENPPPLMRKLRWAGKRLKLLPPLLSLMSDIASAHGASQSQVALNWLIKKNTFPIPGAKSAIQASDNADTMKWALSDDEMEALDLETEKYLHQ